MRRLDAGGDAALHRHVAAQVVRGPERDPGRVAFEAAGRALGGQQRDVELPLQFEIARDVLVVQRVLEPREAQPLGGAADADGHGEIVGPGAVEQQRAVVAHRTAHRLAHRDVGRRIAGRVDFVGGPAIRLEEARFLRVGGGGRQPGAGGVGADARAGGAEQAVEGHPRRLASEVPRRHVHRADRAHRRSARHGPERGVEAFALQRTAAHQQRLEKADEPRPVVLRGVGGRAEEGVAFHARVRADPQQPERGRAAAHRDAGVVAGFGHPLPGEERQRDMVHLHPEPSSSRRRHGQLPGALLSGPSGGAAPAAAVARRG